MSPSVPEAGRPATYRVVIVDDEPLARDCIRLALRGASDVTIVAECGDGDSAVQAIRTTSPDLVFLDVQMPGMDAFGVIDRIGADAMPPVVFVTAFDAHAIRAFEVHALDYVLKPFDDQRLLAALDHARGVVRERYQGELGRRLAEVLQSWNGAPPPAPSPAARPGERPHPAPPGALGRLRIEPTAVAHLAGDLANEHDAEPLERRPAGSYVERFTVREDGRVRFVPAADVDWFEADGNYMLLHVGEVRHRVRASLRDVIDDLDPRRFVRIHRSAIVNVDRIRELQPWFGGDYVAILRTGAKLKVSRRRVAQLLRPMA